MADLLEAYEVAVAHHPRDVHFVELHRNHLEHLRLSRAQPAPKGDSSSDVSGKVVVLYLYYSSTK